MFIRILTSRDGWPVSTEIEVDDAIARDWIACGDAELVAVRVVPPVLETAVVETPVETRVKRGKK